MDLLINSSTDPAFNLALEELLAADYAQEFFMLWRNANAIIVGRNQNTAAEIDADAVRELGVKVVRRVPGGGAVYHDLGNINYTVARDGRILGQASFAECAGPVVAALKRMGVPAEFSGRNDIIVNDRKVSGSARSVVGSRTLFHGTMLFDVNLGILGRVLRPDESKIRAKGIKSVRSRVMNLKELFPAWSVDDFHGALQNALMAELGLAAVSPIPEEFIRRAEALADQRYRTWEWNYGSLYPYEFNRKQRFAGGSVELSAKIENNRVAALTLRGDFFGDAPVDGLAAQLVGCLFRPDAVRERLAGIDLARYMHGITADELASLFE